MHKIYFIEVEALLSALHNFSSMYRIERESILNNGLWMHFLNSRAPNSLNMVLCRLWLLNSCPEMVKFNLIRISFQLNVCLEKCVKLEFETSLTMHELNKFWKKEWTCKDPMNHPIRQFNIFTSSKINQTNKRHRRKKLTHINLYSKLLCVSCSKAIIHIKKFHSI